MKDAELSEWIDRINLILNAGHYEFPIYGAEPGTAQSNAGESLITNYVDSTGSTIRRLEVYIDGQWCIISFDSSGNVAAGGFGDRILDNDANTGIYTQFITNEDRLRHYAGGLYIVAMDTYGIQVASEYKIIFNGLGGNSYWTYSTASGYMQCYVSGSLRMEM